tara:strand:+ start:267 stop:653 length:387 start_codon:yes stop_codon:yes gene_type:complete
MSWFEILKNKDDADTLRERMKKNKKVFMAQIFGPDGPNSTISRPYDEAYPKMADELTDPRSPYYVPNLLNMEDAEIREQLDGYTDETLPVPMRPSMDIDARQDDLQFDSYDDPSFDASPDEDERNRVR